MASNLLTDKACKLAVSNGKSIVKMHDGEGLYLWVFENGAKYWRLRYKADGKEKSQALGVYPHVSLKGAREKRDVARKQIAAGVDPSAERKAIKQAAKVAAVSSFEAVAREWFEKNSGGWSERHRYNVQRRLDLDLFPALGSRPIAAMDAPEVLEVIRKIEARGSHDLAGRVLQIAGQVFLYGIAAGRCKYNLAHGLSKAITKPVREHQKAVRPDELPALLKAIATYDDTGDTQTRIALQLLAHTFTRTSELIEAEWSEFNFDTAQWTIPAERMKMGEELIVPLSRQSLSLLRQQRAIAGHSRFVFPGRNPSVTMSNNTMLFALYRLGYKAKMSGHGFRTVASTVLNESGLWSSDAIELQLAHAERNAIRAAYNRAQRIEERTRMMLWWSEHLDSLAALLNTPPGLRRPA